MLIYFMDMKRLFAFFVSAVAITAVMSFSACKKEFRNDYVEQVQGKWSVASVTPQDPEGAYIVTGDKIEIKSDMTYSLGNSHWEPFFSGKIWTLKFEPQDSFTYLYMFGTNDEKQYVVFLGRISAMMQNNMYVEYIGENGEYYRYNFARVTD